jgi:hypothetical protein
MKQNLTVRLEIETIRKAEILAARRRTSMGELLIALIEESVAEKPVADEAYQEAKRQAFDLLERGFHLGGVHDSKRSEPHER